MEVTGPGYIRNQTESYNGTSWTEVNNLNKQIERSRRSCSNSHSSFSCNWRSQDQHITAATESWNGTSWTEVARFKYC